jgi:hypothetical protein
VRDWRWSNKCQGMFWGGNVTSGPGPMGMRQESRPDLVGDVAGGYAASIVGAVQQVYPNDLHHPMTRACLTKAAW